MKRLEKTIRSLTMLAQWGALGAIFLMMVLIAVSVLTRRLFHAPIIGDYELVQLLMVILIGLGVAYAESIDGHIKVGLLVDRFHAKWQTIIDIFISLLIVVVCMIVGTMQYKAGIRGMTTLPVSTSLLQIPHYPFQFLLGAGFFLWGLEALLKAIGKIVALSKDQDSPEMTMGGGDEFRAF